MRTLLMTCLLFAAWPLLASSRLYLGTDFYYQDFKEKYITKVKGKETTMFRSYQAGYDFEKSSAFYVGGDFQQNKDKASEKTSHRHLRSHTNFINYEGRLGFAIPLWGPSFIAPLIGVGEHQWSRKNISLEYDKLKYDWLYLAYGFRLSYKPTEYFQIKFHAKLLQILKGKVRMYENGASTSEEIFAGSSKIHFDLKKKLCYELELPIIFAPQTFRPFDIALVPYFQKYILTQKVSSSYFNQQTFANSKGKSMDTGVRLEIGFNF